MHCHNLELLDFCLRLLSHLHAIHCNWSLYDLTISGVQSSSSAIQYIKEESATDTVCAEIGTAPPMLQTRALQTRPR
jgi:hypothetical protein